MEACGMVQLQNLQRVHCANLFQLQFLQINALIVIDLVEIEFIAGVVPSNPIVRLCAMPSPTICFYLGFLLIGSAILTQMRKKLPFNTSSTNQANPWRPALLAFVEDAGSIEGQEDSSIGSK
jgi:hypothetical protein